MKYYKCDREECGKEAGVLQIRLEGYYPNKAGGILLPESLKSHDFCSHECFVKWMRWALENEEK